MIFLEWPESNKMKMYNKKTRWKNDGPLFPEE